MSGFLFLTLPRIIGTFSHINHPNFGKCGSGFEEIGPPDSKDDGSFRRFWQTFAKGIDALHMACHE